MSSFSRRAIAVLLVSACALFLPGAYTAADEGPAPSAEVPSEAPTPDPTPSPSPTESQDPDPSPSPSPSPTSPDPSPTSIAPTPTESPGEPEGQEAEPLHLSLGVAPATIELGEETTVGVTLTNPNPDPAQGVDLIVTLPGELGFVSAGPAPDEISTRGGKTTLSFFGLDVPANGWLTIPITAEGIEETEGATVQASALWEGSEPSDAAQVTVVAPEADLRLTSSGPGLLSVVGQTVTYQITLRNAGDSPLSNVSIVNLVPAEVHVTGAGLAPGIDAVQVGTHGNSEDVVWAITEMEAGEVIRVSYRGVVEKPGDLEATNRTRALTTGAPAAETSERTYLASADGGGSANPAFEPIVDKEVVREKVVERPLIRRRLPTEPGGVGSTSALPYSGIDPWGIAGAGIVLIGLGCAFLRFGSRGTDRRRVFAVAFLVLLIGGACISSDPEGEGPGDTRVKGRQIERNDGDDSQDNGQDPAGDDGDASSGDGDPAPDDGAQDDSPGDNGGNAPGADNGGNDNGGNGGAEDDDAVAEETDDEETDDQGTEVVLVPGPRVTTFERRVETVTLTEADLSVLSLSSVTDADPVSFSWNDAGAVGGRASATSPREDLVELTTSVRAAGEGMRATVSIANVTDQTRVALSGRFDLQMGSIATLRGDSVDVVLNPGGSSDASFDFRLPAGTYSVKGLFRAN